MLGECEQPFALDEVTVQVSLLYDQPNFKYCTLFVSGTNYWQTDGQIDRRTDGQTIQTLEAPADLSGGGIKIADAGHLISHLAYCPIWVQILLVTWTPFL